MTTKEAAEVIDSVFGYSSVEHAEAEELAVQALEAWAWVEKHKASVRTFGIGWAVSHTATESGDRVFLSSTGPTPLAAVLDAMEKEKG